MSERFDQIKEFYHSDTTLAGVLRDILSVARVLVVFAILSQIVFGTWTPMRAIESGSMVPHMNIGDIVFIQSMSRAKIVTYQEGESDGYRSFGNFGNVILYKPYGRNNRTPVIHRAIYYVNAGEPMWNGGPVAPHAGYITKGDHNNVIDQYVIDICTEPVRKEWVIGVARFRVPYAGYVRLTFSKILDLLRNNLEKPGVLSQIVFGTWTPMRAIESGSMVPHMNIGDIVFIQSMSRAKIVTYQEGESDGYRSFGNFGSVILYKPYGRNDRTPIIHRAIYYVNAGEPMWNGGPVAPHAGYITKGDHNNVIDQYGICTEPVRKEWVIGVARFRVPYAGYVRLTFSKIFKV